jgi:hypothetical protein
VGFTPNAGPVAHSVKSHNGEEKILKTLKPEERDEDAIMKFKAAHKPAVLNAQAGLILTRMRRARAILGKQSVAAFVPSDSTCDYEINNANNV